MTKKLVSLLVAAFMVLALVPMGALAMKVEGTGFGKKLVPLDTKPVNAQTRNSVVYYADFETDPANDGWTFVDSDGDGNNWTWSTDWYAYDGDGVIFSRSYGSSGALTPDNWAWSPSFTVPATGYTYVDFFYAGEHPHYASEVFAVYAKVNGTDVKLTDDITATGGYVEEIVDISAYAGQTIQIAIRHYNCTDWYMLNVDEFGIYNLDTEYDDGMTLVYTNSFETSSDITNIGIYDLDGDGDYWGWGSYGNGFNVFDGSRALVDASANYNESTDELELIEGADNAILFEDAFSVPAEGGAVSIWASSASNGHEEHFVFLVGTVDAWTNSDSEDDIYIINAGDDEDFVAYWLYDQFWIDLSSFAGEDVYVAVEHCNNTGDNHYFLQIDYLQYWNYDEIEEPVATYTVTFVDGLTGQTIAEVVVEEGGAAEAPEAPVHEGYTFDCWDPADFSNVTENMTVTAQYTPNNYTLTVNYVDAQGNKLAPAHTETVAYGSSYSVASPEIPGYTPNYAVVEGTMGAGNEEITVTYTPNNYTLTINYVDAQGNKLAPAYTATVAYGESYSVASPEIEGYTTDQAVVEGVMGAANVEVNVVYTANETPVEVLPGDANADGVLTSADLSALFAYVMNAGSLTEQGLLNADVNGDGVINTLDVTVLAQLIFGA